MATRKAEMPAGMEGEVLQIDPETGEITEPTTDVATREGDAGLGQWMARQQTEAELNPEQAYHRILQQIMAAETVENVLTPVEAYNATDLIDVPLEVVGFEPQRSEYEVGSPFYFSVMAQNLVTGERAVVNTGNQACMAQLLRLAELGAFPFVAKFAERGRARDGRTRPLRLVACERPIGAPF
jgi:hypothetical protein